MRIGIDCRYWCEDFSADEGSFTFYLIHSLSRFSPDNKFFLYFPRTRIAPYIKIAKENHPNIICHWDGWNRGIKKVLPSVDVYHLINPIPVDRDPCPTIGTVFPQGHLEEISPQTTRKIVITLREPGALDQMNPGKIEVVPPAVDEKRFHPLYDQERNQARERLGSQGIKEPFVFLLTSGKNPDVFNFLRAFTRVKEVGYPGDLVIRGLGRGDPSIHGLIQQLGIKESVIFIDRLNPAELSSLMNFADGFLYPSVKENPFYPLIAAVSCGAVILTARVPLAQEMLGPAGCLTDAGQPLETAKELGIILEKVSRRDELRSKALMRARQFSLKSLAASISSVYQSIYEETKK